MIIHVYSRYTHNCYKPLLVIPGDPLAGNFDIRFLPYWPQMAPWTDIGDRFQVEFLDFDLAQRGPEFRRILGTWIWPFAFGAKLQWSNWWHLKMEVILTDNNLVVVNYSRNFCYHYFPEKNFVRGNFQNLWHSQKRSPGLFRLKITAKNQLIRNFDIQVFLKKVNSENKIYKVPKNLLSCLMNMHKTGKNKYFW